MAGKKAGSAAARQMVAKQEPEREGSSSPDIRVRIHRIYTDENKKLRAFASANIGDFAVHGLALFENANGWSVAMPRYTYKDAHGNPVTTDAFHPVTSESRKALGEALVNAYKQALELSQNAALSAPTAQPKAEQQQEFMQKM